MILTKRTLAGISLVAFLAGCDKKEPRVGDPFSVGPLQIVVVSVEKKDKLVNREGELTFMVAPSGGWLLLVQLEVQNKGQVAVNLPMVFRLVDEHGSGFYPQEAGHLLKDSLEVLLEPGNPARGTLVFLGSPGVSVLEVKVGGKTELVNLGP